MAKAPNLDYIRQLSGGDSGFEGKLISVIRKELPQEIKAYNRHISEKKFEQASDNVHKIKHKMSILGMEEAYNTALLYENALRDYKIDLKVKFEKQLDELKTFIDSCEI